MATYSVVFGLIAAKVLGLDGHNLPTGWGKKKGAGGTDQEDGTLGGAAGAVSRGSGRGAPGATGPHPWVCTRTVPRKMAVAAAAA